MRTRSITVFLSATALAATVSLNAQTPSPQTPTTQPQTTPQTDRQRPTTDPQRPMTDTQRSTTGQTLMITGCLKNEKDVPGLKPNMAERAGVTEDYVLTGVKMSPSSKVSGIALATNYEIEGISKDELKKHVNHQVEITGTIAAPGTTNTPGDDDAPDFHGTSMKMVSASCTAQ